MFLMDLDLVINDDGYFQALILCLEVGEDLVLRSSMSGERDERALHAGEEAKEEKFFITQWCFEGLDSQEDMLKRFGPLDSVGMVWLVQQSDKEQYSDPSIKCRRLA